MIVHHAAEAGPASERVVAILMLLGGGPYQPSLALLSHAPLLQ